MKKYPDTVQFRNIVKTVRLRHDFKGYDDNDNPIYQHDSPYPILKFRGTVKLHGTNGSIVKYADGTTHYQSRDNILSLDRDNAQFMMAMSGKNTDFLFNCHYDDYCAVYGEWCGGNIQKGVAINRLEKMFVIFGIKIDSEWIDLPSDLHDNEQGIYNILQFPTYEIEINFNQPELAQNKMIELTNEVEQCCPVGKYFGVEGVGEGIVFNCITDHSLRFKSKGEKHSVTKVKKLNPIDIEELNNIKDFVEMVVTENRLEQGICYLNEHHLPVETKSMGHFLKWVNGDVIKEENDTLVENQFDIKKVNKAISQKARLWFLDRLNQF